MSIIKKIGFVFFVCSLMLLGMFTVVSNKSDTYAANTLPGENEIITVATTDQQPINAPRFVLGYSPDGNVVLFKSTATNLPNAGGSGGLYIYNIKTDTTSRVDLSTNGTLPNGNVNGNGKYEISETGRYVTFMSDATNLIDGVTSSIQKIYKRDVQIGETTRLSSSGYTGSDYGKMERNLGISNDGRFALLASRYIANSYPNDYGVVYGDNSTGSFNWTSLGTDNNDNMQVGNISCDGAFAVYQQYRTVYLSDLRDGTSTAISVGSSTSTSPIISCDGRYVLYATTDRTDITPTPSGMNSDLHLVRYDRITGDRIYVDSNSSGVFSNGHRYTKAYHTYPPNDNVFLASIAKTGDVVFRYNGNMYIKHLSDGSGTLESIAKTSSGAYVNVTNGYTSKLTDDARYVFFEIDPYELGLTTSPSDKQIIRAKTGI